MRLATRLHLTHEAGRLPDRCCIAAAVIRLHINVESRSSAFPAAHLRKAMTPMVPSSNCTRLPFRVSFRKPPRLGEAQISAFGFLIIRHQADFVHVGCDQHLLATACRSRQIRLPRPSTVGLICQLRHFLRGSTRGCDVRSRMVPRFPPVAWLVLSHKVSLTPRQKS